MLIWSLVVAGVIVLPTAASESQKGSRYGQSAPAFSSRVVNGGDGGLQQTSYHVDAYPASCVAGAAPSCAMPANPACCAPVPSCGLPADPGCAGPAAGCSHSASWGHSGYGPAVASGCYCSSGHCRCGRDDCPCGCDDGCFDRCRNRCAWSKAHTTGDMYPHFPYYPQDHGYYYFRPYNYMHVHEQAGQAMSMGIDPGNPYSNSIFDSIYEGYYAQNPPAADPPLGSVEPIGSSLPMLEDLLPADE